MKIKVMLFCAIILGIPEYCYAYIDPASGSLIIQMVIAFVVGGLFIVKQFWKKIVSIVKGFLGKNKKEEDTDIE